MRGKCLIPGKCAFRDYATKTCTILEDACFEKCSFQKDNKRLRYDLRHYPNPDKEETNIMLEHLRNGDG